MIPIVNFDELAPEEILNRDIRAEEQVDAAVDAVIAEVRARGDAALRACTRRFDGVELQELQVAPEELDAAFAAPLCALGAAVCFLLWLLGCILIASTGAGAKAALRRVCGFAAAAFWGFNAFFGRTFLTFFRCANLYTPLAFKKSSWL